MFEEFFSRAVAAGLISAGQKDDLMQFAKTQPVTSFVASRPPVVPAGAKPEALPVKPEAPGPVAPTPCCTPRCGCGGGWLSALLLALICLVLGAWVGAADDGPLGDALRLPLSLLDSPDSGFPATPGLDI